MEDIVVFAKVQTANYERFPAVEMCTSQFSIKKPQLKIVKFQN